MDENTRTALRQELLDIDQKIAELNARIHNLCWRQSPDGDRRKACGQHNMIVDGNAYHVREQPAPELLQSIADDRRLPSSQRLSLMRRELSAALHRYLALQAQLRTSKNHSEATK